MKTTYLFHFGTIILICILSVQTWAQSTLTMDGTAHPITYSGNYVDFLVPTSLGDYDLIEFQLNGGDGGNRFVDLGISSHGADGGEGATVGCSFRLDGTNPALEGGGTIRFIVGGAGESTNGIGTEASGGGGGTGLLYLPPGLDATDEDNWVILAVAGGGGGAFANTTGDVKNGKGGNDGPDGLDGDNNTNSGGSDGEGGDASSTSSVGGAGGGGYLTDGVEIYPAHAADCSSTRGRRGGITGGAGGTDNGCVDGRDGGWGYGGGGSGEAGGGGGGGYSGGGGGEAMIGYISGGGGGGSYAATDLAENSNITAGGTTGSPGNGFITYKITDSYATLIVAPSISSCNSPTISLDNTGSATITTDDILNIYDAPDAASTFSISPSSFNCNNVGTNPVTVTIEDSHENSTNCVTTVTVQDVTLPAANCQDVTLSLNTDGEASTTAETINNGSSDACGIANLSLSQTNFTCSDVGNNTETLTVTDVNGNSATCTAIINVHDYEAPVALCQNVTLQLDANGNGSTTAAAIDNGSNDACGIANMSLSQTSFECSEVGNNTETLTVTDVNGIESTCTATISVVDNVAPIALCQNVTVQLDANGNGSTTAAAIDNGSNDACGIANMSLSQISFECSEVGNNTETLTVTDVNGMESTCTATISVVDNVAPIALCQNVTVQLDANGNGNTTAAAIDNGSNDACGIANMSLSQISFECSEVGNNTETLTVTDVNTNSATCAATITVQDNISPTAICQDLTLNFNGEQSIGWTIDQLWDESSSFDNCTDVFAISQSLNQATCNQIGSVLSVIVNIEDGSGNPASCESSVTIDGLPCGWYSDTNGINCSDTETDYDPVIDQFSLSSNGCYDPTYYRYSDPHGFIQSELCGDGEIVAHVTEVSGSGWAGISMRQSNDPNAVMLQLMLDGNLLMRREVRMSTGAAAFAHQFQAQGHNWLKLSRSGNQFSAYRSQDGINWSVVFITNLAMANCIEVGLITMNGSASGEVTAQFENVSVSGVTNNALQASIEQTSESSVHQEIEPSNHQSIKIYPNPASNVVHIQLNAFLDQEVHIQLYNHYGQAVLQRILDLDGNSLIQLPLDGLVAGNYWVEIQSEEQRIIKKLVVSPL